ncbi:MAG TPA: transposase [Polyangiaceae bacterium]|nr:transposase [Polyangiaceae bacterium]
MRHWQQTPPTPVQCRGEASTAGRDGEAGRERSTVARRYSLSPSLLFAWRKAMEAGAATGLRAEAPLVPESEVKQLKAQIREGFVGVQHPVERQSFMSD